MQYVEINGRRVLIPEAGVLGRTIIETASPHKKEGRGTTIIKGPNAERVNPSKLYKASDLKDKFNKPVKFGDMPDRTKGGWLTDLVKALFDENTISPQRPTHQRTVTRQPTTVSKKKTTIHCFGVTVPHFQKELF